MKSIVTTLTAVALLASTLCFTSAMGDDEKETKLKCLVNSKADAKMDKSAEYKEGKVYFCCGGCLAKFKKSPEDFAAQANHQLVASKQYVQTKCPFSGGNTKEDKAVEVGGVKVAFCCGNCEAKAKGAEGAEQVKLLFADKAFEKGFEVAKKEK